MDIFIPENKLEEIIIPGEISEIEDSDYEFSNENFNNKECDSDISFVDVNAKESEYTKIVESTELISPRVFKYKCEVNNCNAVFQRYDDLCRHVFSHTGVVRRYIIKNSRFTNYNPIYSRKILIVHFKDVQNPTKQFHI